MRAMVEWFEAGQWVVLGCHWGCGDVVEYGMMRCVCVGKCSVAENFLGHLREGRSQDS